MLLLPFIFSYCMHRIWVIYGVTTIIYGVSQHLHGKSIRNCNSCRLTPAAWMLYLVGNNHKKYFSHSELWKGDRNRCTSLLLFFWLQEEVGVNEIEGAGLIWGERKEILVQTAGQVESWWGGNPITSRVAMGRAHGSAPQTMCGKGRKAEGCPLPKL